MDHNTDPLTAVAVKSRLRTRWFGQTYRFLPEVDSTNRVAMALAEGGAPTGTTVVADTQLRGRGRLERPWFSPPAVNLYCSIVLRPPENNAAAAPQLALLAALALVRAVNSTAPELPAKIKWPNDVWVYERKIAGILCEAEAKGGDLRHGVVGIGVNVNLRADTLPPELADSATSLRMLAGRDIPRAPLLAQLLNDLEALYCTWRDANGLTPFLTEFERLDALAQRKVTIATPGGEIAGIACGLRPDGALLLQSPDGRKRTILAGDVHVRPTAFTRPRD